jgi:bifunctional DNA-binding transcriptional regulator/antitoxin component of YhaV-PrlF toxin-antitoxin module
MVTYSGPNRPRSETKTGRVWDIADEITRQKRRTAKRQEVMDAYEAEGGNPNTASTQYSAWNAAIGKRGHALDEQSIGESGDRAILGIDKDGRVTIPFALRQQMKIGADGRISASIENGELRLVAPAVALQRLKAAIRKLDRGDGSVVDELIRDRRAEQS